MYSVCVCAIQLILKMSRHIMMFIEKKVFIISYLLIKNKIFHTQKFSQNLILHFQKKLT